MDRARMGRPGSFDRYNHHGGVMPGWPHESNMTDKRASKVMHACIQSGKLTYSQLDGVRKCMSYLWELNGTKTKQVANWPAVGALWDSTVRMKNLKETEKREPMRIPTPKDLKTAILRGWKRKAMPLMKWLIFYMCFWDTFVCGARPKVDTTKIKNSRDHNVNYAKGYQSTGFKGGRSKLAGLKKGTRPWRVYRICFCKGKKHRRPHKRMYARFDDEGNPLYGEEGLSFDPICPLACQEAIWQCQDEDEKRNYPNFLEKTKYRPARLGALNIGDIAAAAIEWMKVQGIGEFDHNAGRKCLARWCKDLNVPWELSVHIHGDLPEVWNKHYEFGVKKTIEYIIREQSTDPEVATAALRIFASYLGRGINPFKPKMDLLRRQNHMLIGDRHGREVADKVLMGIPVESDEEENWKEEEQKMQPTPKKKIKPLKRKRVPKVKIEPGELPPPLLKRKKIGKPKEEEKVSLKGAIAARIRLKPIGRGNKFKMVGMIVI